MRKVITYIVEPKHDWPISDCFNVYHGKTLKDGKSAWITNCRERMWGMGLEMPTGPYKYRVTYRLDDNGPLMCKEDTITMFMRLVNPDPDSKAWPQIINCLLPEEWRGKRFTRKVTVL
jgi:hypothetical protein